MLSSASCHLPLINNNLLLLLLLLLRLDFLADSQQETIDALTRTHTQTTAISTQTHSYFLFIFFIFLPSNVRKTLGSGSGRPDVQAVWSTAMKRGNATTAATAPIGRAGLPMAAGTQSVTPAGGRRHREKISRFLFRW